MQKIHKLLWSSQFIVEFVMYYSVGCGTTCDPQHHFCVFCDTLMKGIYLWMWKTAERSLFYATLCTLILKTPQFYFDQILLISNSIKQSQSHSQLLKQDETGYSRKVWTVFFHSIQEWLSVTAQFILIQFYFAFHLQNTAANFHLKKKSGFIFKTRALARTMSLTMFLLSVLNH